MEKVEGVPLSEVMRARLPLPLGQALSIANQICAALVAAHRAGVVHYDIKPHNVMVTGDGQVKVVDFGIAGFVQSTFTVARSSQLTPAGTPEYGAPEQFLTERGDERSDLYALGCVLFAMLTGGPPFTGHSGLAVIRCKLDEPAPRLDAVRPDLPGTLNELVSALLERDPARRPQSAQDVHQRLARLGAEDETEAPTHPPTYVPPNSSSSFHISWTGTEELSTYASVPKNRSWTGALLAVAATAASLLVPIWAGQQLSNPHGAPAVIFCGVFIFPITALILAANTLGNRAAVARHRRLHVPTGAWSLSVGPEGIVTESVAGRSEFPWDRIRRVLIDEVQSPIGAMGPPSLRCSAVHLDPLPDTALPQLLGPAGWPYIDPGTLIQRPQGRIAVCVLGPTTQEQRRGLLQALVRHADERWIRSVNFTQKPIA
ncbi:serine/threonine protein kinase [Streptomyces sp. NBC_00144]|uniref:protein kinase domain-containing protein n=1 Tax=Streptomyces sp. NBC_00144 TaxID=2975665 RepID=UPI00324E8834